MPHAGPATATATKAASRSRIGGDTQIRTGDGAFAELCLTTWLCRRSERESWSGWRESNPRVNLGKVAGYHYITPAPDEGRPLPVRIRSSSGIHDPLGIHDGAPGTCVADPGEPGRRTAGAT